MNSNLIYSPKTDRTPYFYIIQHILSGKLYAGCKYGKDANPSTFMILGGYQTSSNKIKRIVEEEEGIGAFQIIQLITEEVCGIDVYRYETIFLQENNISKRDNWFNGHNNTTPRYHSSTYKQNMLVKYGVEFPMQSEDLKRKQQETCYKNHGVLNPSQSEEIRNKKKTTTMINYGVEFPMQSLVVQQKREYTCFVNLGFTHQSQSPIVKEKKRQTEYTNSGFYHSMQNPTFVANRSAEYNNKTGYNWPMQNPETREKSKETCNEKYGVDNVFKSSEIKDKIKHTMISIYGVENSSQSPIIKERKKETCLTNYGEDSISKVKCKCPYCNHKTNMIRFSHHAKKCFPLHDEVWAKPNSPEEWKKYIKSST